MSWLVLIAYTAVVFAAGFVTGWLWRDTPRNDEFDVESFMDSLPDDAPNLRRLIAERRDEEDA
jgi:hypothetical protein